MRRGSFAAGFLTCLLLAGVTTTAYAAGIMAERSHHRIVVDAATVMVSPTRDLGEDGYEDYDWSDLELTLSDIEALIGMAKS